MSLTATHPPGAEIKSPAKNVVESLGKKVDRVGEGGKTQRLARDWTWE
jgi:hypothetical protein